MSKREGISIVLVYQCNKRDKWFRPPHIRLTQKLVIPGLREIGVSYCVHSVTTAECVQVLQVGEFSLLSSHSRVYTSE